MTNWLHPGVVFIVAGLVLLLCKSCRRQGRVRQLILVGVPIVAIVSVASMTPGEYWRFDFLGRPIILGAVDRLSLIFAYVFTIMAFIGTLFALHVKHVGEHAAAFLYVGSSLGVIFAGDYFSLFVFWEVMAFASAYLVFIQGSRASVEAGFRYLLVHISGGVCLLGGIILHYSATGSVLFGPIEAEGSMAFYMILIGFILNAAAPPLNAWLTDAYPQATVTGAVFMSAFTTKTAVYVLLRAFPGTELLIWVGAIMAVYGVVFATLENNSRRLLGYHIVSQVGFMVAGIGIGTELALNGATAHAFAHIIYKGLLFMAVGSVIYVTGKHKLSELGGLYKTLPFVMVLYLVGAVSISAFPLFSGFVSKSMVIAAAELDHRAIATLLLMLASAGTFLSVGLKLPYHMFLGEKKPPSLTPHLKDKETKSVPLNMLLAMTLAALICLFIGVYPQSLYSLLPYPVDFEPYTASHITGSLSLLIFTALGFTLLLNRLHPQETISLDTDWFYRKGGKLLMRVAENPIARIEGSVSEMANTVVLRPLRKLAQFGLHFDKHIVDGIVNGVAKGVLTLGRSVRRIQTGVISQYALAMAIGVFAFLLFYQFLG